MALITKEEVKFAYDDVNSTLAEDGYAITAEITDDTKIVGYSYWQDDGEIVRLVIPVKPIN